MQCCYLACAQVQLPQSHRLALPILFYAGNTFRSYMLTQGCDKSGCCCRVPASTDESYDRSLWPPGTPCVGGKPQGQPGTPVVLTEEEDKDTALLNGGVHFCVVYTESFLWLDKERTARLRDST
jgi:hypothetical protein